MGTAGEWGGVQGCRVDHAWCGPGPLKLPVCAPSARLLVMVSSGHWQVLRGLSRLPSCRARIGSDRDVPSVVLAALAHGKVDEAMATTGVTVLWNLALLKENLPRLYGDVSLAVVGMVQHHHSGSQGIAVAALGFLRCLCQSEDIARGFGCGTVYLPAVLGAMQRHDANQQVMEHGIAVLRGIARIPVGVLKGPGHTSCFARGQGRTGGSHYQVTMGGTGPTVGTCTMPFATWYPKAPRPKLPVALAYAPTPS